MNKGCHHTEDAKKKMRIAHKGIKLSEETKNRMSEAHKGRRLSKETKNKMRIAHKGKKLSAEHRKKLSEAHKGKTHIVTEEVRKKMSESKKGQKLPKEVREKISETLTGRKLPKEVREKMRQYANTPEGKERNRINQKKAWEGKKLSAEHRKKLSEAHKGERGNNWQGGKTQVNERARRSVEFRLWREAVFARDNWTCQKCQIKGGKLHPHHIKNFSDHFELRFAIDNGITLCKECHKRFHNLYGMKKNNERQLEAFINGNLKLVTNKG